MSAINPLAAQAAAVPTAKKAAGAMDQNDFLKLMTTQLTTQDPFNPVDNTQMVAQMAQFSQVAGIAEMNKSLANIASALSPGRLSDAASWIGRSMLVESPVAPPLGDGSYAGEVALAEDAENVTLSFVDTNGAIVHSAELGPQKSGSLAFSWDGKDAQGNPKANGPVRILVNARTATGAVAATPSAWTTISGIQSPASGGPTQLVTGLGLLPPEAATRLG